MGGGGVHSTHLFHHSLTISLLRKNGHRPNLHEFKINVQNVRIDSGSALLQIGQAGDDQAF